MKFKSLSLVFLGALFFCSPALAQSKKLKDLQRAYEKYSRNKNFVQLEAACKGMAKLSDTKGVKFLLKTGLASRSPDHHEVIRKSLAICTEKKSLVLIAKELKSSKSLSAKLTLCKALQSIASKTASNALISALKAKEDAVRAAAARALGRHALGKDSASKVRRLLKDKSLRVQKAAADSLNSMGVGVKGYEQEWSKYGTPNKVYASDVAIVFDTTSDLFTKRYKSLVEPKDKDPKKKIESVSAMDNMVTILGEMMVKLTPENRFVLVGFSSGTRYFDRKNQKGSPRTLRNAVDWLKAQKFSKDEDRDILRVLRSVIDADTDEVYLITSGLQRGGSDDKGPVVVQNITELAFKFGVKLHTIAIDEPPLKAPRNASEEQKVNKKSYDLKDFVEVLAVKTGGHSAVFTPTLADDGAGLDKNGKGPNGAGDPKTGGYKAPEPVKGRLSSKQVAQIKKDIKAALADPKAIKSQEIIEAVGALPEAQIAKIFLKEIVFGKSIRMSESAIKGLGKNPHPDVVAEILKRLKSERDPRRQVILVRCIWAPSANTAAKLTPIVPRLAKDARRLALEYLASRPPAEVALAKKTFARKFKGLTGWSAAYLKVIMGTGKMPVIDIPDRAYLPMNYYGDGVAFILDLTRAALKPLWLPAPKKEEAKKKAEKGKKKKKKTPKKSKKDKKEPEKKKNNEPISHLKAVCKEIARALYTLQKDGGRALVQELGDSPPSTYGKLRPMDSSAIEGMERWAGKIAPVPGRDLVKSIIKALRNPEVEEIHVLTCGLPLRADIKELGEVIDAIRAENRGRMVRIHITVIFGVPSEDALGEEEKAERVDDIDQLTVLYKTLAEENRGVFRLRKKLPLVRFKKPEKGKK
ncbi:MAG: HEAT repeat domain-containing protein [Planctomycetota bacterium]|nr:HEAT repeat domain-containing protein [Planctomycetota bacterium]